ncbi:MAG TPA: hypothetical protein DCL43_14190 [Chitinophagaceae bacterium]|nr:hypothetical protein [Chitinophagaceae bacterium]HAN37277.1 hypothetical protein [Chitinophagaceae bacterium]
MRLVIVIAMALLTSNAIAQTPVEIFTGSYKTTFDVMFFKYFKTSTGANSKWLLFNRNRYSVDYLQTTNSNLPQFGSVTAISYNVPTWHGVAPVMVAQVTNRGVSPKLGLQYASMPKNWLIFSWLVGETLRQPSIDYFLLLRYTPTIQQQQLFTQVELVNTIPTTTSKTYSFIQRFRLGLKHKALQYGAGIDITTQGLQQPLQNSTNAGIFIRYEFQ